MTEGRGQRTEGGSQPQLTVGRRPSSVVRPLILAVILMLFSGCGVKGAPFLTEQKVLTFKVDQLEGAWDDKSLVLKGLVQGDNDSLSLITGCRVHYVWYSLDQPPCEGCPIEMKNFRDITGQIISDGQFSCELPAFKQKGICFVMVRLMEEESRLGPSSGRIKLISDL
jgi:hypothetical protein